MKSLRRNEEGIAKQEETEHNIDKEKEFSQSVDFTPVARPRTNSLESTTSSFHQSVQVVPGAGGKYEIYPGAHNPTQSKALTLGKTWGVESLHLSRNYMHNISNPDLWRNRVDESEWQSRKESVLNTGQSRPVLIGDRRRNVPSEGSCNCGQYHSHTFRPPLCTTTTMKRESFTESIPKKSPEVRIGNVNQLTIYNIFWCAELAFSDYKHGMKPVNFQSLWPKDPRATTDLIRCGVEDTGLRSAFWELCVLSILSGPLSVLKALLDLSFIRKYSFSFIHTVCIEMNTVCRDTLIKSHKNLHNIVRK